MISTRAAEEYAEQARQDLGLGLFQALSPAALLARLEIPVLPLSALLSAAATPELADAVRVLTTIETAALSAATVFYRSQRLIIHNDSQPQDRVVSNLAHEAAHALLLHQPRPALDGTGCRDWQDDIEAEATYLAGCLLIPGAAARLASRKGWSDAEVAEHYEVSEWMARYRLNKSGARRQRSAS